MSAGSKQVDPNLKQHYFLLTGEVVYVLPEDEEKIPVAIRINGIVVTEEPKLPLKSIARAQQVLQMNFMQRMNAVGFPNPPHVVDTVVTNIVHLGLFTHGEFYRDMKTTTEGPVTKA